MMAFYRLCNNIIEIESENESSIQPVAGGKRFWFGSKTALCVVLPSNGYYLIFGFYNSNYEYDNAVRFGL